MTPRTVNKEVASILAKLNKGAAWGRVGSNPISRVKPLRHDSPTKERRELTAAEALVKASPDYLRPVWRMFLTTGVRRDELTALTFNDVDLERRTVTVRAETSKNHKAREIPLDDETFETIDKLHAQAKDRRPVPGATRALTERPAARFSRDHVFVTTACMPWGHNLLRTFYACCGRAGIQGAHRGGSIDLLRSAFRSRRWDLTAAPTQSRSNRSWGIRR